MAVQFILSVHRFLLSVMLLLFLTFPGYAQTPVGNAVEFQGLLNESGSPAEGTYDLRFTLYNTPLGGGVVGSVVFWDDVPITGGLVNLPLDFGAGAFGKDARWLEVAVRDGASGGAYTPLSPRQRIFAAPVALQSLQDAHWDASGSDIHNSNSGDVGVGETSPLARLHVQGTTDLPGLDAGDLSTDQIVIEGGQAWLGLYSDEIGAPASGISLSEIHSQTGVLTKWSLVQRSSGNGNDLSITYGSNPAGNANARYVQVKSNGDVGIGVDAPAARLHVKAVGTEQGEPPNSLRITSEFPATVGNTTEFIDFKGNQVHAVENSAYSTLALQVDGGEVGIGLTNASAPLHVRDGSAGFFNSDLQFEDAIIEDDGNAWLGLYSDNVGNVGSGITLAEKTPNAAGAGALHKWGIYARTTANVGDLVITYGSDANPTSNEKMLQIDRDGTTKVKVLEILGADVAERFPCSEAVAPGQVVMIDAAHPGQLCLARGAYNRKVAGIVSGAGDLPAGAILGNLPGNEQAPAIALSGRVWVRCDATERVIEPGDLLTTAERVGLAMKVEDHARAMGATVGKAMTGLPRGETGLVLVLVNLQ